MATTTLTVRVSSDLKDRLDRLAQHTHLSKSYLAGEAIADYVERELAIVAGIEEGLDDMKTGRVVPHERVMNDAEAAIRSAGRRPSRK